MINKFDITIKLINLITRGIDALRVSIEPGEYSRWNEKIYTLKERLFKEEEKLEHKNKKLNL